MQPLLPFALRSSNGASLLECGGPAPLCHARLPRFRRVLVALLCKRKHTRARRLADRKRRQVAALHEMRKDWFSCDGRGGDSLQAVDPPATARELSLQGTPSARHAVPMPGFSRRNLLVGLGLGSIAWAMPRTALSQIAIDPKSAKNGKNIVVSIFLRGGADGLNVVVPYAEDAYHRNRPTLRLLKPGEGARADQVLDLDGFFGFNPALADLLPLYHDGRLAIVHAAGSGDQTRSHFEAMNTMERGLAAGSAGPASGWLASASSKARTSAGAG